MRSTLRGLGREALIMHQCLTLSRDEQDDLPKVHDQEGETSVKKGGERRRTLGPNICGAVNWPGKTRESCANELKIFPGRVGAGMGR
jgi:hypothetical protein